MEPITFMNSDYRKITENKGSFIIRLPMTWAIKKALEAGKYVKIEENADGNLVISKME